jgi:hypothetical protein
MGAPTATEVYLELGKKRVFACAYDWPGWCRSGRDEDAALSALRSYMSRYTVVTRIAKLRAPEDELLVVERLSGSATTDFGAPGAIPARDGSASQNAMKLVRACWNVFDAVVKDAPAELRKGPRGGGRDRDKIVEHVYGAESAYAAQLRLHLKQPPAGDAEAVEQFRAEIVAALKKPPSDAKWPTAYAARRIAWHALDHAWEIEDRSA